MVSTTKVCVAAALVPVTSEAVTVTALLPLALIAKVPVRVAIPVSTLQAPVVPAACVVYVAPPTTTVTVAPDRAVPAIKGVLSDVRSEVFISGAEGGTLALTVK